MNVFRHFLVPIAILLAASAAIAQYPGGSGSAGRQGGTGGMGAGRGLTPSARDSTADVAQMPVTVQVEGQLDELREDLKPTSAQRDAWNDYATRLMKLAGDVMRDRDRLRFPKGTVPEQLDFVADTARNRLTAIEDIADAGKRLYAQLSPSQQDIADRRLARLAVPLLTNVQSVSARPAPSGDGDAAKQGRNHPTPP